MKFNLSLLVSSMFLAGSSFAAEVGFKDSFDTYIVGSKASANTVAYAPMTLSSSTSTTSSTPVTFRWESEAYTEVVDWSQYQSKNISAKAKPPTGSEGKMLKFSYYQGADSWSEQRFSLSKNLRDIWMQYDIYIPASYSLIDAVPNSANYFGGGHKVAVFFADGYSHPNTTMVFGEVFARKDRYGASTPPADNAPYYIDSTLSYYPNTADTQDRRFQYFGTGDDRKEMWVRLGERDRWQRRTFHFKFPSAANKNDGLIEVWIQRFDASGNPVSVSKEMHGIGDFYGKQNYFNGGYINGYNNDGFKTSVDMLVDNFRLAEGNFCAVTEVNCVIPSAIDKNAITVGIATAGVMPSLIYTKYTATN